MPGTQRFVTFTLVWIAIPVFLLLVWHGLTAPAQETVHPTVVTEITEQPTTVSDTSQRIPSAPRPTSPASVNKNDLQISGIVRVSVPGQSIALISVAGLPPTIVREGDLFFDWHVLNISPYKVQLRRQDETVGIFVTEPTHYGGKPATLGTAGVAPAPASGFRAGPRVAGVPGLD